MILLPEEQETHISMSKLDDSWTVYTTQKTMMTKLEKIGLVAYQVEKSEEDGDIIAKYYKLPVKQLTFAKERKKTEMSEERRNKLKEHMKNIQKNKSKQ